jgi:hypothetical protein
LCSVQDSLTEMKGGAGVVRENAWITDGYEKSLHEIQGKFIGKHMRLVFVNTCTETGKGVAPWCLAI